MSIQQILQSKVNGATFISIDTETSVTLTGGKSNPHQGRVQKRTLGSNVMLFANKHINGYEAMVMRRLSQEGKDPESFVLSPRKWGMRVTGEPFVTHNERMYLEVIFMKAGKSTYFLDGQPIDKKDVIGLTDKEEAEQGGLDKKVIIRTYAFDSIRALTINGERFELL